MLHGFYVPVFPMFPDPKPNPKPRGENIGPGEHKDDLVSSYSYSNLSLCLSLPLYAILVLDSSHILFWTSLSPVCLLHVSSFMC